MKRITLEWRVAKPGEFWADEHSELGHEDEPWELYDDEIPKHPVWVLTSQEEVPDPKPAPPPQPNRWKPMVMDRRLNCYQCQEPIGQVDVKWGPDSDWDGEAIIPFWQCQMIGMLLCDDCHSRVES